MAGYTKSVILLLLLGFSTATGDDKKWNLMLSEGDTLYNCTLLGVTDSMLVFSQSVIDSVAISSVSTIFRHTEGSFWTGAGYGALAGAAVGAAIGAASYEKPKPKTDSGYFSNLNFDFGGSTFSAIGGGVLGSIGGLIVGGIIGSSSGGTDSYELSGKSLKTKIMVLRMLSVQKITDSEETQK